MKQNIPNPQLRRDKRAPEPARKSVIFPVILIAALLAVAAAVFIALKKSPPPAPDAQTVIPPVSVNSGVTPVAPAISAPARRNNAAVIPSAPSTPATPIADNRSPKEILASLTQLDAKEPLPRDQWQTWKQALQQLIRLGPAAVPAIRDYLAQNKDVQFFGWDLADQSGFPTLRAGLIDALGQIGGPDATAAELQILQSSIFPSDVAQLAKGMGDAATGPYQQEFLAAVRQQLFLAQQPEASHDADVAPVFQVLALEAAGGATVAQDIQQYASPWAFYSAITLAHLPDDAGLPVLTLMAQTPGSGQAVAVDTLAQLAVTNPQALAALLDTAKNGAASDYMLAGVVPFLAGRQYVLFVDQIPPGAAVQSDHIASGNQNFLSCQVNNPALAPRQIAVLDQLLQAVPPADANALQALQDQKSALTANPGKQP
jgi:hypothetical protein